MDPHRECIANGECRPAHHSTKQTGKWCRGRVGIPHIWMWERGYVYGQNETGVHGRWLSEHQRCFTCDRKRWTGRTTCVKCGAHRRTVYSLFRPVVWGLKRYPRPYVDVAYACDCPDNQHPGWFATREEAKAAA